MTEEDEWDKWEAYFLSGPVCEQGIRLAALLMPKTRQVRAIDLGAGGGVFGQRARIVLPGVEMTGVEVRKSERPAARHYTTYVQGNYFDQSVQDRVGDGFDLVTANPPFSRTRTTIEYARQILAPRGVALFFVRRSTGESLEDFEFFRTRAPIRQADIPGRITLRRGKSKRGHELNGDHVGHKWLIFRRGYCRTCSWPNTLLPPLPADMRRWTVRPGTERHIVPIPSFYYPQI